MQSIRLLTGTTLRTMEVRAYRLSATERALLQKADFAKQASALMKRYACRNDTDPFTLEPVPTVASRDDLVTFDNWCFDRPSLTTYAKMRLLENRRPKNPLNPGHRFSDAELRRLDPELTFTRPPLNPAIYLATSRIDAGLGLGLGLGRSFFTFFIMQKNGMLGPSKPREFKLLQSNYREIHPELFTSDRRHDAVIQLLGAFPADFPNSVQVKKKIVKLFELRRLLQTHQMPPFRCTLHFPQLSQFSQFSQIQGIDAQKWSRFTTDVDELL